jgi:hypothetical protein
MSKIVTAAHVKVLLDHIVIVEFDVSQLQK